MEEKQKKVESKKREEKKGKKTKREKMGAINRNIQFFFLLTNWTWEGYTDKQTSCVGLLRDILTL